MESVSKPFYHEEWIQWQPFEDVHGKYSLKIIQSDSKEFFITLYKKDSKEELKLSICGEQDIYRVTKTYYRQDLFNFLKTNYGELFYKDWTFFKIKNSSYKEWLEEESYGVFNLGNAERIHYCLLTDT